MKLWKKMKSLISLGTFVIILPLFQFISTGPVRKTNRITREVYPEIEVEKVQANGAEVCIVGDVVYGAEEPVPTDQPCLKCKCKPPGVQCETSKCVKKPGCRAIHKPNECCPEYQCECEHEGKIYANGERMQTPLGGECRVCYCRGGEIQCAEVSCYIRTDCEGRTVPGQCCPKYDHCPPKELLIDRLVPYPTQPSLLNNMKYWSSNSSTENKSISILYGITKTGNEISVTETEAPEVQNTLEDTDKLNLDDVKLIETTNLKEHYSSNNYSNDNLQIREQPRITIQEIIPEIKEIPITGPPKREINLNVHEKNRDGTLISKNENNISPDPKEDFELSDTESDSSEISEIYHAPPPVLKIGDQLLVLKKGELFIPINDISTPLPVITIIGAEGLQRGTEDSGELHEGVTQERRKDFVPTSNNESAKSHIISFVKPKNKIEDTTTLSTIQDFLLNISKSQETEIDEENLDLNTSVMTEGIINKIKTLTNVESTENVGRILQKVFISDIDYNNSTSNATTTVTTEQNLSIKRKPDQLTQNEPPEMYSKFDDLISTIKSKHEDEATLEQNPEYPPLPDIMGSHNIEEQSDAIYPVITQINTENILLKPTIPSPPLLKNLTYSNKEILNKTELKYSKTLEEDSKESRVSSNKTLSAETENSKETLEESNSEDSGELTTHPNSHPLAIFSVEDASVDSSKKLNIKDLVETISGIQYSTEETENTGSEIEIKPLRKDVELIDPQILIKDLQSKENITTKEDKLRLIRGHKVNIDKESDDIFKQLNEEIKTTRPNIYYNTAGNEDKQAEAIFRELLEDATSSSIPDNTGKDLSQGQEKESVLLQRVSEAITKFTGKDPKQSLDVSILGILRDFFSS